jgi:AcrR family transcriptional regulator
MVARPKSSGRADRPDPGAEPAPAGGGPGVAPRRAPFSANPLVGARGRRTQHRILDAALRVFGEDGYHQSGVDRITRAAGCSRASFYQYFSGKEDVFRQLAEQVTRQVHASIEALGPLTPDADGRAVLRDWVDRYAEIHHRYGSVFQAFQTAAESDETIVEVAAQAGDRYVGGIRARLATTALPPRHLGPMVALLVECLPRTLGDVAIVHLAAPTAYPLDRVGDALADVLHRALFGLVPGANVRPPPGPRPEPLDFGPVMREAIAQPPEAMGANAAGRRTVQALLESGRDMFVARGYHRTRINDVVAAAGVSHGAFYRYFESKDQFAHVLAVRAFRKVSAALADIPEPAALDLSGGRAALRRWLRRYNATQAAEATMIRVWVDAALQDTSLRGDSAAALDWGRRRMARFLSVRDVDGGDVEHEAIVLVALLSAFGSRQRSPATVEAAVHVLEQAFLGRS